MFLHLIDDSHQLKHLINRTNQLFPGEHLFYALTKNNHLKSIPKTSNIVLLNPTNKNIKHLANEISKYKAVFVHNLCYIKSKIILLAPENTVFIWGVWGFDYYYVYPEFFSKLFLPYTKLVNFLLLKQSLLFKKLLYALHPASSIFGITSHEQIRIKAAGKMVFTITNMPNSDVFQVIKYPIQSRFRGIYYSTGSINKNTNQSFHLGNNIFLGNSATNSSNHIDIFLQLKKLNLENRHVIVPLSYGCNRYKKLVNLAGKIIFKSNFIPLNHFIPLEKYNEQLFSCNVMIFNHKRAQAFGNIIFGIWAGHKIFLRSVNPIYPFLKSLGIVIYSIENELLNENLARLEPEIQLKNREIIENQFGENQIRKNYHQIIEAINNRDNAQKQRIQ